MSNSKAAVRKKISCLVSGCISYFLLWLLLTGGEGKLFGALMAISAALLSCRMRHLPMIARLSALPGFIGFFLIELWLGAWDVARRAVHPQLPLNPAWVQYRLQTPHTNIRLLLSAMTGLLPGTLASHFEQDVLHVHVLDQQQNWADTIAKLESHLSLLFTGQQP